jgi:hypothetical protein
VEGERRQPQPLRGPQDGLVGQVDDGARGRRQAPQPAVTIGLDLPAVVVGERTRAQLLFAATEDHARQSALALQALQRVADGSRMVLAVHERDRRLVRHAGILPLLR